MAAMRAVGRRSLPPQPSVREESDEYLIELDVSDFAQNELTVDIDLLALTRGLEPE